MLLKYSQISISYKVNSIFKLELLNNGLDGIKFSEEKVLKPFLKNDDDDCQNPVLWAKEFDIENWGIFAALKDGIYLGGMALAYKTPIVNLLEGKDDMAVLWDIRIRPEYRGKGIGSMLFEHGVKWSKERGCKRIKIETQRMHVDFIRSKDVN